MLKRQAGFFSFAFYIGMQVASLLGLLPISRETLIQSFSDFTLEFFIHDEVMYKKFLWNLTLRLNQRFPENGKK